MDTDWCLTCDCHFQGIGPYCSLDCKYRAGPSSQFDDWTSNDSAAIIAWASEIPSADPPIRSNSSSSLLPPKLLRSNHPVAPTLCMTTPPQSTHSPSRPIFTPKLYSAALSMSRFGDADSMGKISVLSADTDSSLATPASNQSVPFTPSKHLPDHHSILGALATHVRSWVSPSTPLDLSLHSKPSDTHKFSLHHSQHSSAVNITFPSPSPADDDSPVWHLSSTIRVDKPSKSKHNAVRDIRADNLPYKSRGRKLLRVVA